MRTPRLAVAVVGMLGLAACAEPPPGRTYYERTIQPILTNTCAGNTSGCHRADPEDPFQFAAGNFDVTSFENVQKRRDLLVAFGPYQVPPLLIKAVGPGALTVSYNDVFLPLEIPHVGGANLEVGSDAYLTLMSWLDNGATENGLSPPTPPLLGDGDCSTALAPDFDPTPYVTHPAFARFTSDVQPILADCASGNCHGAPQADFYVVCGDDEDQRAFNFAQAWAFVADPVDQSPLLEVPLAVGAGGRGHSGGDHFSSRADARYQAIRAWSEEVGPIEFGAGDPGKEFFADNVQPLLITRGCSFQACHSPVASNDLKLRAGSQGLFSAIALERNYEVVRDEFMAMELADARRGRAVAKNLIASHGGIAHRGGPALETPGEASPEPAACPPVFDPATASAFCTFQAWVDLERGPLLAAGEVQPLGAGDTVPIVYVDRDASHVATPLEVDTYQPGADLRIALATLDAAGSVLAVGASSSLLDGCAGAADRGVVDVRSPDVRHDAARVVFAMRTSAGDRLGVWAVDLDGADCRRLTSAAADRNGLEIHDLDPAWSPDGAWIVFASTRGKPAVGPSPSLALGLPQTDLWRFHEDGSGLEQMTFLSNSELAPQFMRLGRVTMTTEKVSDGFYQLSGRRQNWDLTDYHPLLGQRQESAYGDPDALDAMLPSIGYAQATDIREAADGDFLVILSDAGARGGAGALGIFNRSVGPIELGRDDPGYMRSLRLVDSTTGVYRGPLDLPDGQLLVSYASFTGDLGSATSLDWDLVAVDPRTGARRTLIGGPGAQVDAVLALRYPARALYLNHRQLVFGGSLDPALGDDAIIHMPDAPLIFTLLTGNLRRGRPVDEFRRATQVGVYVGAPPPDGTPIGTAPLRADGSVKIRIPSSTGAFLALLDDDGDVVVTMTEEHQLGPGEQITMGIVQSLFDAVCGGCHGAVSGSELDVAITPDALTGASRSMSAAEPAVDLTD